MKLSSRGRPASGFTSNLCVAQVWSWDRSDSFEVFALPAPSRCTAVTLLNSLLSVCIACDNACIYVVPLTTAAVSNAPAPGGASLGNVHSVDCTAECGSWGDENVSAGSSCRFRALRGHSGPVRSCVVLGDGRLASCAADGVRLWDLAAGVALAQFGHFGT